MSDVNKNYLNGRIKALEATVAFLESEVTKWKEAYDDAHEALQGNRFVPSYPAEAILAKKDYPG